jgi:hypothetical protein
LPHAITRRRRQRQETREDRRARDEIRQLDQFRCRVCGRRTSVVHEEKRRGAGGPVSPENSYLACDLDTGGVCHPLLQNRHIYAVMANGADAFDAREDLVFEMTEKVAAIAFEGRERPAHVRIVEGD